MSIDTLRMRESIDAVLGKSVRCQSRRRLGIKAVGQAIGDAVIGRIMQN
jgi:hypothetical protein